MHSKINTTTCQALRACRKKLNITQGELAERLGVTLSTVSDTEAGRNLLTLAKVQRYCTALGVKLDVVIGHSTINIKK